MWHIIGSGGDCGDGVLGVVVGVGIGVGGVLVVVLLLRVCCESWAAVERAVVCHPL